MYQKQDTLHHVQQPAVKAEPEADAALEGKSGVPIRTMDRTKPKHPYQVLGQLPPNATPAQQDSAMQAVFRPEQKHLGQRPDTLHLSAPDKEKSSGKTTLPQYYRESFFSNDSLFHPEVEGARYGIAGDPLPYAMRNDHVVTGLLLACFILALLAFARTKHFIFRQAKKFFYVPRSENVTTPTDTTGEYRFLMFLILQTGLICSLLIFFYTLQNIADTFVLASQYQLIGIFFGCIMVYFVFRTLLATLLNLVFFNAKKNMRWLEAMLFLTAVEGVVLFPLVLLQSYFDLSMQGAVMYMSIVLILVKLLTFYKCYVIFFKNNGPLLQIILYFCALEIIPLIALGGFLIKIVDYLKINI
ncbi:MAG: DUF4271 domain-containing protein [Prevotellaceae bacterium]|nr:DUF4271 domain-containing protein [Prevotellaceae bacterium]MDY6130544.1 DUF4271 domain-containing protein [Prevotella sp.]